MHNTFMNRLKHAWDVFTNRDPTDETDDYMNYGYGAETYRPGVRMTPSYNPNDILSSVYNKISMDVCSISIKHVLEDEDGTFLKIVNDSLNDIFNETANLDQSHVAFVQDVAMSLLDEGVVALVPVKTTIDPNESASYKIKSMRVGRVVDWYPKHVRVKVYNDDTGRKEEVLLKKENVGIIENPLYAVMNEPNSTLQRLRSKLALLDAIDKQSGSGKLDIIIQLPYLLKGQAKKEQAQKRAKDIESQLANSQYGIAYTDATEKVIQLNRPAENNLMEQIEYLTSMLYSQLGLTKAVFEGSADEKTMLNYFNRTIDPILNAIASEVKRKFLTKTAITQGHSIQYFRDPFKLISTSDLAEIADKFTRNEIMTSNEMRAVMGMMPANDPKADELRNSNLNSKEVVKEE